MGPFSLDTKKKEGEGEREDLPPSSYPRFWRGHNCPPITRRVKEGKGEKGGGVGRLSFEHFSFEPCEGTKGEGREKRGDDYFRFWTASLTIFFFPGTGRVDWGRWRIGRRGFFIPLHHIKPSHILSLVGWSENGERGRGRRKTSKLTVQDSSFPCPRLFQQTGRGKKRGRKGASPD